MANKMNEKDSERALNLAAYNLQCIATRISRDGGHRGIAVKEIVTSMVSDSSKEERYQLELLARLIADVSMETRARESNSECCRHARGIECPVHGRLQSSSIPGADPGFE